MSDEFQEKRLGYLHEVGLQGGVRKAADMLGVNASVVSRQIALLERSLHLPLLQRRGRTVVLTEAGKLLADHFVETRTRRESLTRHLTDLRYMRGGTVSVRIGQGMISNFVMHVLREFSTLYPDVFVDISTGDMKSALLLMVQGDIDLALSFGPLEKMSLNCRSFSRGPICAIVPAGHRFAGRTSVSIQELGEERLIAFTDAFGIQRYVHKMFESRAVVFSPAYRCNLLSGAITLCRAGLGVAFMTEQSLGHETEQSGLEAIPIDHPIAQESLCHLLRSSDRRLSPAAEHLWRLILAYLERGDVERLD